mgnify:CR=1 FL=1
MTRPFTAVTIANPLIASTRSVDQWVTAVAEELGTTDLLYAEVILRSWLHTLRNRLAPVAVDQFAADLPQDVREMFSAGWDRTAAPANSDASSYTIGFARSAVCAVLYARGGGAAATAAVMRMLPPVEVYKALDELSPALRVLINPGVVLHAA